jgi:hypothetical protein
VPRCAISNRKSDKTEIFRISERSKDLSHKAAGLLSSPGGLAVVAVSF